MLIGACGLVCSECTAFQATQAGDAAWIARIAEEWGRQHGGTFQPEEVWCDGCMSDSERKCSHCPNCEIRLCVLGRGVANCAACADYGCEKITEFFAMVPEAQQTLDAQRAGG